jgi:hypothetical protein
MWFYQLSLVVALAVLFGLWQKNTRLQQKLSVYDAAEAHFSQGNFPIDLKMVERLQSKVGELFDKESYDSENWQRAFDLFTDVSKLINYWLALHPSEARDAIEVVQQAGGQQVISHTAKRVTIKALAETEDAEPKPFVFTIDGEVAAMVNQLKPGTFPELASEQTE